MLTFFSHLAHDISGAVRSRLPLRRIWQRNCVRLAHARPRSRWSVDGVTEVTLLEVHEIGLWSNSGAKSSWPVYGL